MLYGIFNQPKMQVKQYCLIQMEQFVTENSQKIGTSVHFVDFDEFGPNTYMKILTWFSFLLTSSILHMQCI